LCSWALFASITPCFLEQASLNRGEKATPSVHLWRVWMCGFRAGNPGPSISGGLAPAQPHPGMLWFYFVFKPPGRRERESESISRAPSGLGWGVRSTSLDLEILLESHWRCKHQCQFTRRLLELSTEREPTLAPGPSVKHLFLQTAPVRTSRIRSIMKDGFRRYLTFGEPLEDSIH
jgi:hypothetical protein